MRKFTLSLVLCSALFATTTQEGLKAFNSGDFKTSYEIYKGLFLDNLQDSEINFYLARSAFELGLYDEAISAFERVLILDPAHLRSRLELGRAYLSIGDTKKARAELMIVLESDDTPKSVKENVRELIAKIDAGDKKSSFRATIFAGLSYDSNVNASPGVEEIEDYFVGIGFDRDSIEADDIKSDMYGYESYGSTYTYDFGSRGGFYLESSANLYNQHYFEENNFDIQYLSLSVAPSYSTNNYRFSLPLAYERVHFDYSHLMDIFSISPRLTYALSKDAITYLELKFQERENAKSSDRDSRVYGVSFGAFKDFSGHLFGFEGTISNENKKNSNESTFVDKNINSISLSYKKELFSNANLGLNYRYKFSSFKDMLEDNQKREDKLSTFGVSLSKDLKYGFGVIAGYTFQTNSSNYQVVKYDKNIYSLAIAYTY